jgi:predicted component of type VI protein secretion system
MQVVLVMFRPDGERRSFSLPRQVTVIGRREDCDLRIPLGDVSRKHCRFVIEDDALRVEDLGSSNGTFHNGVRVQEAALNAGDTVSVGPVSFVIQINGVPADEEIIAPRPMATARAAAGEDMTMNLDPDAIDSSGLSEEPLLDDVGAAEGGAPQNIDDIVDMALEEGADEDEDKPRR